MYALIFFLIILFFSFKKKPSFIPTNWPVVGMMPALLLNFARLHDFITNVLIENDGTFFFRGPWFTTMDMLVTSDPANIHYILTKNFHNFPKGPDFKKMFDVLGDGIFNAESESWETQRRTAKSLINHSSFQELVARTTWSKLETGLFPCLEQPCFELDLQDLFKRFAFDCSCLEILGYDPGSLSSGLPHLPYEKAFDDAEEAILYRHVLPESSWKLVHWLGIKTEKRLSEAKATVDRFLIDCIALKRDSFCGNEHAFDLLTCHMRAEAEDHVSEEIWKDTVLNLIFAGKDTISAALTWFFWLLATNPAEEEKIRQEMLSNLHVDELGKWKYDDNMDDLKRLVYLHGALCEALRLYPPISIQHKAPMEHDVLPSGHRISPNTRTLLSFYSMGRMKTIWGEDCLEFKPGRWISEAGRIKNEPSFKFSAFNAGPRSCLGKEMSFVRMKIVAAALITRFRFVLVPAHQISPRSSVVIHMKRGFKVKVSKLNN